MDVILRFTYSGTSTDFYRDEVAEVDLDTVQGVDIYRDISGYHHLVKTSAEYNRLRVQFKLMIGTTGTSTIDKLETLLGYVDTYKQPVVITCFYEYSISTTNSIQVQMKRDDFIRPYIHGLNAGNVILPITFIESVPAGVAIALTPIGV